MINVDVDDRCCTTALSSIQRKSGIVYRLRRRSGWRVWDVRSPKLFQGAGNIRYEMGEMGLG